MARNEDGEGELTNKDVTGIIDFEDLCIWILSHHKYIHINADRLTWYTVSTNLQYEEADMVSIPKSSPVCPFSNSKTYTLYEHMNSVSDFLKYQ